MNRFQKWLLLGSSTITGLTGLAYWWMKHMMEPTSEWSAINHPLQPWILKAHILAAPLLVFSVGLIASSHIFRHLRNPDLPGRKSGHTALWLLAPMVLTGYLIQTVTHQGWLSILVWTHLLTGGGYLVGLGAHQWVASRRKRRRRNEGQGRRGERTRWRSGEIRRARALRPGPF